MDSGENVYLGVSGLYPTTGVYSSFIRRFDPNGGTTILAGGAPGFQDGLGAEARFSYISDLAFGPKDDLYIADSADGNRIRRLDLTTNTVSTVAGSGALGTSDGATTSAEFVRPMSIQVASSGAIYVLEGCSPLRIRMIDPEGNVKTVLGGPTDAINTWRWPATRIALDEANGYLYLLMGQEIKRLNLTTKTVEEFAGGPQDYDLYRAGVGTQARFNFPRDLALDGAGNLFVTDTYNNCIRKIVLSTRKVINHAGNPFGGSAWEGQDGVGWEAVIPRPTVLCITPTMSAYFIDSGGRVCRMPSTFGLL